MTQISAVQELEAAFNAAPQGTWHTPSAAVYAQDQMMVCSLGNAEVVKAFKRRGDGCGAMLMATANFISMAHNMTPKFIALVQAVEATIDADGDLRTLDMGRILSAMDALRSNQGVTGDNPADTALLTTQPRDVPDAAVKVTVAGGPQEQVEWKISQNLTDRWGEINDYDAKKKPLALLTADKTLLERLVGQMWDECTFVARKDGQFGILFEVEFCSIESEGEEAVREAPNDYKPHETVVAAILNGMLPLMQEYPGVSFAVPEAAQMVKNRPAAWAFVPDGLLNAEQRAKLGMTLLGL